MSQSFTERWIIQMKERLKMFEYQLTNYDWPGTSMAKFPSNFFSVFSNINEDVKKYWKNKTEINLYIHIPFCKQRCPFCQFFSIQENDLVIMQEYMKKLKEEISFVNKYFEKTPVIKSIAFGGGTPNYIPVSEYGKLFDHLKREGFEFDLDIEPSMEVNPELLDWQYMEELKAIGIKRLSIGLQSLDEKIRVNNKRNHFDFYKFASDCKKLDLNFNTDIIVGLEEQTEQSFMTTLEKIVEVSPESISIYPLSGLRKEQLEAKNYMSYKQRYDLFDQYYKYLLEHDYQCESHIKFVKKGKNSTHQLKIYEYSGVDTLGVGCGAVSYNNDICYSIGYKNKNGNSNAKTLIEMYLSNAFDSFKYYGTYINNDEKKSRYIIFSLLLNKLDSDVYFEKFGSELEHDFREEIECLITNKLVYREEKKFLLTEAGIRFLDLICLQFLTDSSYKRFQNYRKVKQF